MPVYDRQTGRLIAHIWLARGSTRRLRIMIIPSVVLSTIIIYKIIWKSPRYLVFILIPNSKFLWFCGSPASGPIVGLLKDYVDRAGFSRDKASFKTKTVKMLRQLNWCTYRSLTVQCYIPCPKFKDIMSFF